MEISVEAIGVVAAVLFMAVLLLMWSLYLAFRRPTGHPIYLGLDGAHTARLLGLIMSKGDHPRKPGEEMWTPPPDEAEADE
jgi:hypothetical protein